MLGFVLGRSRGRRAFKITYSRISSSSSPYPINSTVLLAKRCSRKREHSVLFRPDHWRAVVRVVCHVVLSREDHPLRIAE